MSVDMTGQILDGIALYAKLAMSLRHRIASGEWKVGERLPTVEKLAAELNVSKVTVRQAFAILSAAGIIDSKRGKGTYVRQSSSQGRSSIRSAINDVEVNQTDLEIRILGVSEPVELPPHLGDIGHPNPQYIRLDKIHVNDGVPFSMMEVYICADLYAAFPAHAEKNYKIVKLLHDAKSGELGNLYQSITVEPANKYIAERLDYTFAAPVARVRRTTLDKEGNILLSGLYWYRGDKFLLETEIPAELTWVYPSLSTPVTR